VKNNIDMLIRVRYEDYMSKGINCPVKKGVAKVPVVMQLEALECGAASLAMILAYYDKWIPLEQVRKDCGVSRDGSNAMNVIKAARFYGLKANGYRMEPETLRENGVFPCIVHWEFNHFIVVRGFKKGKVYINDPGRGDCVLTMEEFDQGFTGICLMMEPGEGFSKSGHKKSVKQFALKQIKGSGAAIAFIVITSTIASFLGIIRPGLTRVFMDRLLTGKNPDWIPSFMTILIVLTIIEIFVGIISILCNLNINGKLAMYGESSYMWKVLRMPMEFFSQRMAGDIQARKISNAAVANTIVNVFAPLVLQACMLVFYLVLMLRYSVILTIVGLASVVINFIFSRYISAKRINITRVLMRDMGKLESTELSGIEMIETIKSSGAEDGFFEKWSGYQASVLKQNESFTKIDSYLGIIPSAVTELSNIFVLVIGVFEVINGNMTTGMIMAFQAFLISFNAPATTLIAAGQTLQEMRTDMERIEDVMEYPIDENLMDREESHEEDFSKLSGLIEIKNVTFGYSPLAEPLIEDFSMTIKPGSKIAFVGSSGCGKSTLSKLISGLYMPWSGEILFDGRSIKEIDRDVFTGSLSVVDQDIILFNDTIANNIKMWDDSIQDFEVIMAARDAQMHNDIIQREGGYQYVLTEGGKDFSGGQRQRLEIARVLAQDPTIIIMDEATSALDAKTEYNVVKSIKERGITCIVVAHRLSTIRDCDEIVVLDKGKVIERGTHDELYALGGMYTELVSNE